MVLAGVVAIASVMLTGTAAASARPLTAAPRSLAAGRAAPSGDFGQATAISGSIAVVGAPETTGTGQTSGAVFIYVLAHGRWSQQAELKAPAGASYFGGAVAVSGATVVVGAPYTNSATLGSQVGAAYVYARPKKTWKRQAVIFGPASHTEPELGWSVAVSGSTALIGVPFANGTVGAADIYVRSGTRWPRKKVLTEPAGAGDASFGYSVALSGATAVVGQPFVNAGDGAAFVYAGSGSTWTEQDKLAGAGGEFGWSVAVSRNTAVIGEDSDAGGAVIYARTRSTWSQQAELTGSDAGSGSGFGRTVAVSGSTALVAAPYQGTDAGAVYVFGRSGTTWPQQAELATPAPASEYFGQGLSMTGTTALIGAKDAAYLVTYAEGSVG